MGTIVFDYRTGMQTRLDDGDDDEPSPGEFDLGPLLDDEPPEQDGAEEYVILDDGSELHERLSDEGFDPLTIFGDTPSKVDEPTQWPRRCVGFIRMFWGNVRYRGSGVLISDRHVLTCAHNVWPRPQSITFRPGQTARYEWIDKIPWARRTYVPETYIQGNRWAPYDYAVILLERPPSTDLGHWDLFVPDDDFLSDRRFEITGYPSWRNLSDPYFMRADIGSMKRVRSDFFGYRISTAKGLSGGPIWTMHDNRPKVIGVHNKSGPYYNYGMRLNATKLRRIQGWLADS